MTLQDWVTSNKLDFTLKGKQIGSIRDVGTFLILQSTPVLDSNFNLILTEEEYKLGEEVDYLLFQFGDKWFYSDKIEAPELVEFRYIGHVNTSLPQPNYPYLGIHGGYDLCNGSRLYRDWVKKAKFLGITTLGIAEEHTLAGVVSFQDACKSKGVKSIVGETVKVIYKKQEFWIKLYCKSIKGWKSLLQVNTYINVTNQNKEVTFEQLAKNVEDLVCVLQTDCELDIVYKDFNNLFKENLFFSLDLSEWSSQERDISSLFTLQNYFQNYQQKLKSLLISDSYYLEQEHNHIRSSLGVIGHSNFRNISKSHFFKTIDDYYLEFLEVSVDSDVEVVDNLLQIAIQNTQEVFKDVEFQVITGEFYLPKYIMSEEEALHFTSNEELFRKYIDEGLQRKVINSEKIEELKIYEERIEKEFDVIKRGGFIDYFLILADVYRFCRENQIWFGVGRGSAAGCLISYLCDIVSVDPIKYNLIFERFLNEGRLGHSLPDIDCDFQGERREEVKGYLISKYGRDYVMSIGTYGTFKLRNGVKDLARVKGIDHVEVNYLTPHFPEPAQQTEQKVSELFHTVANLSNVKVKDQLKGFMNKNYSIFEDLSLILSQPKNASIHAAGMVIVPNDFGTIYEQLPVKLQDGNLVSEWEGHYIDIAGFLKIDVLGIKQLDKFAYISKLIYKHYKVEIKVEDIDLSSEGVYKMFHGGFNEDVFQFGAPGLKAYCKELKPDNIEDLIATVALYRPGPIESGTHTKYIKRKNGDEDVECDEGCEEVTASTYGLIVYQEQVMEICQKLAGFSLVKADDVRKGLGKMKKEIVDKYEGEFLEETIKRGYNKTSMKILWDKMAAFASYAFNRSHAACYAVTGYYSQWFKEQYPLEFWVTSLEYSDDKEKPRRLDEIQKTGVIEVKPIDINRSENSFSYNKETNTIYWSLLAVKWVGEKVVEVIIKEREEKGEFFSLEEFVTRMSGVEGINKRSIQHLILTGAFDSIENLKSIKERYKLLEYYSDGVVKEEFQYLKLAPEHKWVLKQKELCGFGLLDYTKALYQTPLVSKVSKYSTNQELLETLVTKKEQEVVCAGLLMKVVERTYQVTKKLMQLEIQDNTDTIFVTLWDEVVKESGELLKKSEGSIVILSGDLQYDDYKSSNVVASNKQTKIHIL